MAGQVRGALDIFRLLSLGFSRPVFWLGRKVPVVHCEHDEQHRSKKHGLDRPSKQDSKLISVCYEYQA